MKVQVGRVRMSSNGTTERLYQYDEAIITANTLTSSVLLQTILKPIDDATLSVKQQFVTYWQTSVLTEVDVGIIDGLC